MVSATIEDIPDPIIEYILSYLSPYRDLKQCMLVNRAWYRHVHDVVRKTQRDFTNAISAMSVQWHHLILEPGPTISKRYSHSACCCGDSMYVFGGCTTANTTFNDLWRLDLGTRCWIRPLATGTYPPPKACASLVCHEDNLVLFGGWTHTSPYPLHQVWRIFNHLHMYNTSNNRWTQIVTPTASPAMAGHSATIHGDLMVVFGGIQRQTGEGPFVRHSIFCSCNDVWVLNLRTLNWRKQPTSSVQPLPRYGHSQISVDHNHLLIMGGCGGPNMLFSDIWLLKMHDDPNAPWEWQEMNIRLKENAAPHLAFHPACKVGTQVVVMSKSQRSRMSPSSLPHLLRAPSRTWVPPTPYSVQIVDVRISPRQSVDVEPCVNGKKGILKRQFERHPYPSTSRASSSDEDEFLSRDVAKKVASSSSPKHTSLLQGCKSRLLSDSFSQASFSSQVTSDMAQCRSDPSRSEASHPHPSTSSTPFGPSGLLTKEKQNDVDSNSITDHSSCISPLCADNSDQPRALSIKPNARCNRQRQLEGLDRMEQRLRALRAGALSYTETLTRQQQKSHIAPSKNPMYLYVLDISTAISEGFVTWRLLKNQSPSAPEEIILYSLVLGRGELIMFGGIQKDLNSRQQDGETVPEVVSNSLHFMSAEKFII